MGTENFLMQEAWENLHDKEEGFDYDEREQFQKAKGIEAYQQINKIAEHSPLAKDLVVNLKKSLLHYVQTVDRLTMARVEDQSPENKAEADLARRLAHDAFISNINILSRYCVKNKLDTSWRSVIGMDRKEVTNWALRVWPELVKESGV